VLLGVSNLRPGQKKEANENPEGERNGCLHFCSARTSDDHLCRFYNYNLSVMHCATQTVIDEGYPDKDTGIASSEMNELPAGFT
jgi:hypothetical protein